jgi:hypothetical protein
MDGVEEVMDGAEVLDGVGVLEGKVVAWGEVILAVEEGVVTPGRDGSSSPVQTRKKMLSKLLLQPRTLMRNGIKQLEKQVTSKLWKGMKIKQSTKS